MRASQHLNDLEETITNLQNGHGSATYSGADGARSLDPIQENNDYFAGVEAGDLMPDDWETFHNVSDPAGDEDGDGLANLGEYIHFTDPNDPYADDDGDGIPNDDEEFIYGTNPLLVDSDFDGLSDAEEIGGVEVYQHTDWVDDGFGNITEETVYMYWSTATYTTTLDPTNPDSDGDQSPMDSSAITAQTQRILPMPNILLPPPASAFSWNIGSVPNIRMIRTAMVISITMKFLVILVPMIRMMSLLTPPRTIPQPRMTRIQPRKILMPTSCRTTPL